MCECELCHREVEETTFHHLIPVMLHRKNWYKKTYAKDFLKNHGLDLCDLCHRAIHRFYDEKTLGQSYNTLELLLESEKIQKHVEWAMKQK